MRVGGYSLCREVVSVTNPCQWAHSSQGFMNWQGLLPTQSKQAATASLANSTSQKAKDRKGMSVLLKNVRTSVMSGGHRMR